jgi:hypothetical protein
MKYSFLEKKIYNLSKAKPAKYLPIPTIQGGIDYLAVRNAEYKKHSTNDLERLEEIKKIKGELNLDFLNKINKTTIINGIKTLDTDGIVFKKIDPYKNTSQEERPNNYDWSISQHNKKLLSRRLKKVDDDEVKEAEMETYKNKLEEEFKKL